jgi:hypothetical protein
MADSAAPGRALRVYQILLVLGLGWAVGRLPALFEANDAERTRLDSAIAGTAAAVAAPLDEQRIAAIAADVAARVAAAAADETVARLVAAGWGPGGAAGGPPPPQTILIREPQRSVAPPQPIVHVIQQAPAWSLPPQTETSQPAAPTAKAALPPPAASPASAEAFRLATDGYAALSAGDRRAGADRLAKALATDPGAPQAAQWAADLRRLTRRWSVDAYSLARTSTALSGDPLAASPVLGGGQTGATLFWTPDPLARRPVFAFGRVTAAANAARAVDSETAEAAVGVRWRPLPGVATDVERRFALGPLARSTWAARLSAGKTVPVQAAGVRGAIDVYGETGIVGFGDPDFYGGAQARAGAPVLKAGRLALDAGAGAWGGAQQSGDVTASRLDLGPSVRLAIRPWAFTTQIDYRFRAAGNAEPGSGPVLTLQGSF